MRWIPRRPEQLLVEFSVRHHANGELGLAECGEGSAEIHNTFVAQGGDTLIERPVSGCSETGQENGAGVVDSGMPSRSR